MHIIMFLHQLPKLLNSSTPQDATSGINTISITGISSGFHAIESLTVKNTISTVYVKEKERDIQIGC